MVQSSNVTTEDNIGIDLHENERSCKLNSLKLFGESQKVLMLLILSPVLTFLGSNNVTTEDNIEIDLHENERSCKLNNLKLFVACTLFQRIGILVLS